MSKKFLTGVIVESSEMTGVAANRLATDLIEAIKKEIIETGRFSLPEFGSFIVRETPKRTALNPRTGEKVAVKAGATVRFKPSPALKESALAGLKKAKRKAARSTSSSSSAG
ncbi:HU family DNA-binding protein [Roseomonas gilardii subsp. gilardii]|nr:HU family DNA-binding protein [Roseomonas gilardii]UPG71803.1 HU family DNA-binding protein [Roseomonas gilardii subsp. gilardii]